MELKNMIKEEKIAEELNCSLDEVADLLDSVNQLPLEEQLRIRL